MMGRIWTCKNCGKAEVWGPTWIWWGSMADEDTVALEDLKVYCSSDCALAAEQRGECGHRSKSLVVRSKGYYLGFRPRDEGE